MYPDFKDLLSAFNARGVEYLVVGAYALAAHGLVRATRDLDLWVRPDPGNAARVLAALRDFGAPTSELREADLSVPGLIFQIGVEPVRIDVITQISGVEFADAWADRVVSKFADLPVAVLSRALLIRNKRAAGRKQDLIDAEWLELAAPTVTT